MRKGGKKKRNDLGVTETTGTALVPGGLEWKLVEITFPLSVEPIYNMLFGTSSQTFWTAVYTEREMTDVDVGDWQGQMRVSTLTAPGKGLRKDVAFIIEDYQILAGDENGGPSSTAPAALSSGALSKIRTPDVTCGTLFQSLVQYEIVASPAPSSDAEGAPAESCTLKVTGGLEWYANTKRCLVKKAVGKKVRALFEENASTLPALINKLLADKGLKQHLFENYTNTTNTTIIATATGIAGDTRMSSTAVALIVIGTLVVSGCIAMVIVCVRRKKAAAATIDANNQADVQVSPLYLGDSD